MVKANKKSIDAKAYINGKVNDMREQFVKAPDEEARKQLVKTFRETTSSDEYQEKLGIVREDTDIVRRHARRKKWEDLTSQEFKDAKIKFYDRDMDLEFWEEFEKLKLWERVNYIFDKFWDTDYAAGLITDILNPRKYYLKNTDDYTKLKNFECRYKTEVLRQIFGSKEYEYTDAHHMMFLNANGELYTKFWYWDVALSILGFLLNGFTLNGFHEMIRNRYVEDSICKMAGYHRFHVSEKTIKRYLEWKASWSVNVWEALARNCAIDWSISDKSIIDLYVKWYYDINDKSFFKKVNTKLHKYFVDRLINEWKWNVLFESKKDKKNRVIDDIDLWDWIDVGAYIIDSMFTKCGYWMESALFSFIGTILRMPEYHDKIVDLLYENVWKIKWLREIIWKFDYLTEVEKAKILWNTEEEDRLNREKFDSDLAKLQELWAKLWKQIVVQDIKGETQEEKMEEAQQEQVDDSEMDIGTKKKRRGWFIRR